MLTQSSAPRVCKLREDVQDKAEPRNNEDGQLHQKDVVKNCSVPQAAKNQHERESRGGKIMEA